MMSLNGNLILKPYDKIKKMEEQQKVTGFITVKAKNAIEPLELLTDAVIELSPGQVEKVKKGCKVYFKEEILHTQPWSKNKMKSEAIEGEFVVGNLQDVVFIEKNKE